MVTMTELKREMKKVERDYEKSEYFEPGRSMRFSIEAHEDQGGMAAFVTDSAENWYIDYVDPYYDSYVCYIVLARYRDSDEVVE